MRLDGYLGTELNPPGCTPSAFVQFFADLRGHTDENSSGEAADYVMCHPRVATPLPGGL